MSTTFRKKPVEIQAMQTAPADPMVAEKDREEQNRAVARWIDNEGGNVLEFDRDRIRIDTLEGAMYASPGDWIIRGVQGEFYPCKPDIFEATYEQPQLATAAAPRLDPHIEAAIERFFTASDHEDVVALRNRIVDLGAEIDRRVPAGRNKALALTALEDVQMRGNRGLFAPEHLR
jgi:hypothetical protein